MRVVFWNCNMAFHRKHMHLTDLRPDIAVVSECATINTLQERAPEFKPASAVWTGDNLNKGLAVFTFNSFYARAMEQHRPECPYIFPVRIGGPRTFNLLAVWARYSRSAYRDGIRPLRRSLDIYESFLNEQATIIGGDFNDNVIWDHHGPYNHSADLLELERRGFLSAYHFARSEKQGSEREPTIYWQTRKLDGRKYHIDYCFVPASWVGSVTSFGVGTFHEWVGSGRSDHVPLIADFDIR